MNILAHGVQVDNPTAQWWYIPSGDKYIAPYTLGFSCPLDGTRVMDVRSRPPPGQVTNRLPNITEVATFTFTEETQPYALGTSLGSQAVIVPQQNNVQSASTGFALSNAPQLWLPGINGFSYRVISYEVTVRNPSPHFISFALFDNNTGADICFLDCKPRATARISNSNSDGVFNGSANSGVSYNLTNQILQPTAVVGVGGVVTISYILVPTS